MHAPIQSRGQHIVRGPSLGGADADKVSPAGQESFPSRFLPRAGRGRPGSPDTRGVCGLEGPALPALFRALGGVLVLSPPSLLCSWRGDVRGRVLRPMWDEGI